MYVSVLKVKGRNGKKGYRYVRIVESYRRKGDGMPVQRVIVNLGDMPDEHVQVLKTALAAIREGQDVVALEKEQRAALPFQVVANLKYLGLAVGHRLWLEWGLGEWLDGKEGGEAEVAISKVVEALVLQRLCEPGSKLKATRWCPETALPELLGMAPEQFNNSRVHRVLEALERHEEALQKELSRRVWAREGGLGWCTFLDLTDTWFEGDGPGLARMGSTKEGLMRKKVGIALACNHLGYPLRWAVVAGTGDETTHFWRMLEQSKDEPWRAGRPVVMDRAMGTGRDIERLVREEILFLTAAQVNEYGSYTNAIPHAAFADLVAESASDDAVAVVAEAGRRARKLQMTPAGDRHFVLDLGLVTKGECDGESGHQAKGADPALFAPGGMANTMAQVQRIAARLAEGKYVNYRDAAKAEGLTHGMVFSRLKLTKLSSDIQSSVREGDADNVSLASLLRLSVLTDHEEQRRAYDALVLKSATSPRPHQGGNYEMPSQEAAEECRVRAVVYLSPECLVEHRNHAHVRVAELHEYVRKLNTRLASPYSRRSESSILGEVGQKLRRLQYIKLFSVHLDEMEINQMARYQVRLERNEAEWARQRRFDGFYLLLAAPSLNMTGPELLNLYHSKDKVEKDFQAIKGQLELRPVRHFTDAKVKAHVTLCMLALLLERTLGTRLSRAGAAKPAKSHAAQPMSAKRALEILASCHLNQVRSPLSETLAYTLTEPTPEQAELLKDLGLEKLADNVEVTATIIPRQA